jgi:hypothetical protein
MFAHCLPFLFMQVSRENAWTYLRCVVALRSVRGNLLLLQYNMMQDANYWKAQAEKYQTEIVERDREIVERDREIAERDREIGDQAEKSERYQTKIVERDREIAERDREIADQAEK